MATQKQFIDLDFQSVAKIIGLPDASNPNDPVTLQQLNNFLLGRRWKEPVRVATTANLSLSAPGATIDGVTMATSDRVLVKNQTTGSENGIYVWNGASSAMTRATDADSAVEVTGAVVPVTEGTAGGDKIYNQTADSITLGTTALVFTPINGTSVVAGNGLTGTSTISVLLDTNSGLIVSGSGIKIDRSGVPFKFYKTNAAGASETFTHGLGNTYPQFQAVLLSTKEYINVKWTAVDANSATIDYNGSQTAGTIGIIVQG